MCGANKCCLTGGACVNFYKESTTLRKHTGYLTVTNYVELCSDYTRAHMVQVAHKNRVETEKLLIQLLSRNEESATSTTSGSTSYHNRRCCAE